MNHEFYIEKTYLSRITIHGTGFTARQMKKLVVKGSVYRVSEHFDYAHMPRG